MSAVCFAQTVALNIAIAGAAIGLTRLPAHPDLPNAVDDRKSYLMLSNSTTPVAVCSPYKQIVDFY